MVRKFLILVVACMAAVSVANADQLPASLRGKQGMFAFCDEEPIARRLVEVRKFGSVVAEDAFRMALHQDGTPLCRSGWLDMREMAFVKSINMGVIAPIDMPPFNAHIVHVSKGSAHFFILVFYPLEQA